MSSHLMAMMDVPKSVVKKINSILSTFFWGEKNGRAKAKWCAWSRMSKPVQEGGLGLRDFSELQRALHMKMAWHLLSTESLWSRFLLSKYGRGQHVSMLEVQRIRDGLASFWFDRWFSNETLACMVESVMTLSITIKEVWIGDKWNVEMLESLVGEEVSEAVMSSVSAGRSGQDVLVWRPTMDGRFTTATAWEFILILSALDIPIPSRATQKAHSIVWVKSPTVWWKLNVDGSCRGNPGHCDEGGVIRDHRGHIKAGFSAPYGVGTSNEVELRALLQGVRLVVHQFREGNQVADYLARKGEEGLMWRYCPSDRLPRELRGILKLDVLGFPLLRKVSG
ncbi:hypothetical protein I3760_07G066400 [Carya illinoinensis]|nr:hypothetical protein I3760_07G066400 [Carya illinoinensis]